MSQPPPNVLSFAACDPSSGAGSHADALTITGMGCHPLPIVTAITVQDTSGVKEVLPLDAQWIDRQARIVLNDVPVHAFKLGVLGSTKAIETITEILLDYPEIPVVLDPVLASGQGDVLTSTEMIETIRAMLLPRTTVLTPNSIEACRLANVNKDQSTYSDYSLLEESAYRLLGLGCQYVLITGTHEDTPEVINALFADNECLRSDAWKRLPHHYHGSGCTLSSAIAAMLATGKTVPDSVVIAQEYTWKALAAGYQPGKGQYIPNRFFRNEEKEDIAQNMHGVQIAGKS